MDLSTALWVTAVGMWVCVIVYTAVLVWLVRRGDGGFVRVMLSERWQRVSTGLLVMSAIFGVYLAARAAMGVVEPASFYAWLFLGILIPLNVIAQTTLGTMRRLGERNPAGEQ